MTCESGRARYPIYLSFIHLSLSISIYLSLSFSIYLSISISINLCLSMELCSAAAWAVESQEESQVTGYEQLGLGVGVGVGLPCTATARAAGLESRAGLA